MSVLDARSLPPVLDGLVGVRTGELALIIAGVVVGVVAAFVVSAEVYHYRRFRACEVELEAAVQSGKTLAAFTSDTRPDGLYRRLDRPDGGTLRQLVDTWPHAPERAADIEAKASRAQTAAVFLFGDMVYVLLFDKHERLREFVCVGN